MCISDRWEILSTTVIYTSHEPAGLGWVRWFLRYGVLLAGLSEVIYAASAIWALVWGWMFYDGLVWKSCTERPKRPLCDFSRLNHHQLQRLSMAGLMGQSCPPNTRLSKCTATALQVLERALLAGPALHIVTFLAQVASFRDCFIQDLLLRHLCLHLIYVGKEGKSLTPTSTPSRVPKTAGAIFFLQGGSPLDSETTPTSVLTHLTFNQCTGGPMGKLLAISCFSLLHHGREWLKLNCYFLFGLSLISDYAP